MHAPLLIEVGIEELPAIPFLKELPNISTKWSAILKKYRLEAHFELFYTPRRIVLLAPMFPKQQPPLKESLFGPPLEIAFKEGKPTKAAESFAQKCGVQIDELGRANKEGKEVLFLERTLSGESSAKLLGAMIEEFISSLNFGKSMRWGSLSESFIRPIRWLGIVHGEQLIKAQVRGVKSVKRTFVHRADDFAAREYEDIPSFLALLAQNGVILDQKERREKILREIRAIEQSEGICVELDEELLNEVVAITEYPTALLGHFDERFLALPPEVIITSMKENQRYFATHKANALYHGFVVVSNARSENSALIIKGNEKVLRARLTDALFFYQNDLKSGFVPERLAEVTFVEGLGNMAQKSEREREIALILFELYAKQLSVQTQKSTDALKGFVSRAAELAKADLMSESVYEFTELQGVIGYHLAKALGENALICEALREQYLPKGEESELPASLFSSILALAYRLDNLMGLFSLGKIPSGSKDPFALRRAASGLLRIVWQQGIAFNLEEILRRISPLYRPFEHTKLKDFIIERIESLLVVNKSFVRAVIAGGESDLLAVREKIEALNELLNSDEGKVLSSTFKRVANIIKGMDMAHVGEVRSELLCTPQERTLYEALKGLSKGEYKSAREELSALLDLRKPLNEFFENVLVNAEDPALKGNRQRLIAQIYQAFLRIADIKEISL